MCIAERSVHGDGGTVVIVVGHAATINGRHAATHGQAASVHVPGCSAVVATVITPSPCMFSLHTIYLIRYCFFDRTYVLIICSIFAQTVRGYICHAISKSFEF